MKIALIIFVSSIFLFSCSKKPKNVELKYTAEEFTLLSSHASMVNPAGENAIPFSDYAPGVNQVNSKTIVFERLKFYAVEFESESLARSEALRLNQYYSRNYLLDRVEGEPILEDFVIQTYHAKNPNRAVQRVPPHSSNHGEAAATHH